MSATKSPPLQETSIKSPTKTLGSHSAGSKQRKPSAGSSKDSKKAQQTEKIEQDKTQALQPAQQTQSTQPPQPQPISQPPQPAQVPTAAVATRRSVWDLVSDMTKSSKVCPLTALFVDSQCILFSLWQTDFALLAVLPRAL